MEKLNEYILLNITKAFLNELGEMEIANVSGFVSGYLHLYIYLMTSENAVGEKQNLNVNI